jgi:NAD(P) transhydrogenase subunit alpha
MEEFMGHLTVFVLASFVGWQIVWKVAPALHTPLMSVANAISGIIVVGSMLAAGYGALDYAGWLRVGAVFFAMINVVGGFWVTQRMRGMFKKRGGR